MEWVDGRRAITEMSSLTGFDLLPWEVVCQELHIEENAL